MTKSTQWDRAGLLRALLAAGLLVAACRGAASDEAGDVRAGEDLARKICSRCHVVSEKAGPPFAQIAKGPDASPDALRAFLH
jgi:mono/diheme cytochrome c family protein